MTTVPDRHAPPLRYAYGTNGLADLRLTDAFALLAELGYDGVGLTLDHMHLDPLAPDVASRTALVRKALDHHHLAATVETGARYVLDARRKHHPTLLDPDPEARGARLMLLLRAVDIAAELGARAVHFFSGVLPEGPGPEGDDPDLAWARLADGVNVLADAARTAGVPLAVEPEPGHLLQDLAGFHRLRRMLGAPDDVLGLTLDIGHCLVVEDAPPPACVRAAAPWLRHVQIEDMRRGVHDHLPFGEGELDVPPVLDALRGTSYQGLVTVELPRHSHAGPACARDAIDALRQAEQQGAYGEQAEQTELTELTEQAVGRAAGHPATRASGPTSAPPSGPTPAPPAGPAAERQGAAS